MTNPVYWNSGNDWGTTGGWTDNVGAASANIPQSAGTAYFTKGSDTITANLNQSAVDLAAMYESEGSSVRIGGSGASLQIDVNQTNTGILDKGGNGIWYITGTIFSAIIRQGYVGFTGGTVGGTGTFAGTGTVMVLGGEVSFNSSVVLTSNVVEVKGGVVTIDYKSGDTPTVNVYDGTLTMTRRATALNVYGGRVVYQVENTVSAATSITVYGGSLDYRAGFVTTLTGKSGTIDFSNQTKPITVTNSTFSGARAIARTGANGLSITYTNPPTITAPPDGVGD